MRNGLQKINDTSRDINDMTKELEKITDLILKRTKECEEMSATISKDIVEIDEHKKKIDIVCVKIKKDELKCQEMYDLALVELKVAIPGLADAINVGYQILFYFLFNLEVFIENNTSTVFRKYLL